MFVHEDDTSHIHPHRSFQVLISFCLPHQYTHTHTHTPTGVHNTHTHTHRLIFPSLTDSRTHFTHTDSQRRGQCFFKLILDVMLPINVNQVD